MMTVSHFAPGSNPRVARSSCVHVEALPPSRTHEHRGIRWTPCDPAARCECSGRLEILQGSKGRSTAYALTLFPTDWNGTAARLDKADGSEHYNVYVAHDGRERQCDCPGFAYAAKERADRRHGNTAHRDQAECKHIDAVLALIANGWLAHPSEGPAGGDWSTSPAIAAEPAADGTAAECQPETKARCRHCGQKPVSRPRGLCWGCFYTPAIREQYPSESPFGRRSICLDNRSSRPLPEPTPFPPGDPAKVEVLAARASTGQQLWHPADADYGDFETSEGRKAVAR